MKPCGDVVSATFWITIVGAPIWPASVVWAALPSMATRYPPCPAFQVNVKEAAGITAL